MAPATRHTGPQPAGKAGDAPSSIVGSTTTSSGARTVPGGSASLRGLGENFEVNPANGTLSLGIPIPTTASRDASSLNLSLTYDSGRGNGPFGVGWDVTSQTISCKTSQTVPRFDGMDIYVLGGVDDLVPALDANGKLLELQNSTHKIRRYRPRTEDYSNRIEQWTSKADFSDVHWRVTNGQNVLTLFGTDDSSRVFIHTNPGRQISSWLPTQQFDPKGNAVYFRYKSGGNAHDEHDHPQDKDRHGLAQQRQKYLKSIRYGNRRPARDVDSWEVMYDELDCLFEVVFDYGEHDATNPTTAEVRPWRLRKDAFLSCRYGFEVRTSRLCERILMVHHIPEQFGVLDFVTSSMDLKYRETPSMSVLESCQLHRFVLSRDGSIQRQSLPACSFDYEPAPSLQSLRPQTLAEDSLHVFPKSSCLQTDWVDLNGDGAPGFLSRLSECSWVYQQSLGPLSGTASWKDPLLLQSQPVASALDFCSFQDLNHDGSLSLVYSDVSNVPKGFSSRTLTGWTDFTSVPNAPKLSNQQGRWMSIDLTGDGLPDLVVIRGNVVMWHRNLGNQGFSDLLTVPHDVDAFPNDNAGLSLITAADMTGDGMADLVCIENGSVTYHPNLGHGRFGPKIYMAGSPGFDLEGQFDPQRVRMADVVGNGTADLLYFSHSEGLHVYYNQAGNQWSTADSVTSFPGLGSTSNVDLLDLVGIGTTCLAWTQDCLEGLNGGRTHYLDLTDGKRPNLLTRFSDGMGSSHDISYKPSTWFALQDEVLETPWITKLPFPVHCVQKVTKKDSFADIQLEIRYRYHDGYFDGTAREYGGFGNVEVETSYSIQLGKQQHSRLDRQRIWYHTTAPADVTRATRSAVSLMRCTNILPVQENVRLGHNYQRALRGRPIREEIWDCSRGPGATEVCKICEFSYSVSKVQNQTSSSPPVLVVSPRDTIEEVRAFSSGESQIQHSYHYAPNPYGKPTKSLSISYGKLSSNLPLERDRATQQSSVVSLTQIGYTALIDERAGYLIPQEASKVTIQAVTDSIRPIHDFSPLELSGTMDSTLTADLAAVLPDSPPHAEVINATRTTFRSTNLTRELGTRDIELFSVPASQYELVCTPKMVSSAYGQDPRYAVYSLPQCGFMNLDGDGSWWKSAGRALFSEDPASELRTARQSFFSPTVREDSFGNRTVITMDVHHLLPTSSTDAVGNTARYVNEYVHLQRIEAVDSNGIIDRTWYDALGMPVARRRLAKDQSAESPISPQGCYIVADTVDVAKLHSSPSSKEIDSILGMYDSVTIRIFPTLSAKEELWTPGKIFELVRNRIPHDIKSEDPFLLSVTYTDSNGEPLQTAQFSTDYQNDSTQWRFNAQDVKDQHNNTIATFDPYFSDVSTFKPISTLPKPASIYWHDGLLRPIGTLKSDGTWNKLRYSGWSTTIWDEGSTAAITNPHNDPDLGFCFHQLPTTWRSQSWISSKEASPDWKLAIQQSAEYAGNSQEQHLDPSSKTIVCQTFTMEGESTISTVFDAAGHVSGTYDELGRLVERRVNDLTGFVLLREGMDYGARWQRPDCNGEAVLEWNSRRITTRTTFDGVRRSLQVFQTKAGEREKLVEKFIYGDAVAGLPQGTNLRNQLYQHYQQTGLLTYNSYDIRQRCTSTTQSFALDYESEIDWTSSVPLLPETWTTTYRFDDIGNQIQLTNAKGHTTRRTFDSLGHCDSVAMKTQDSQPWTTVLKQASFLPNDLPSKIVLGNGCVSGYTYDSSWSVIRQKLSRASSSSTHKTEEVLLQDKEYTYDSLRRKITSVDHASGETYTRNNIIKPRNTFSYDARGRLVSTTGRESLRTNGNGNQLSPPGPSGESSGISNDANRLVQYEEQYDYNVAGNILRVTHRPLNEASLTGWTRRYTYSEPSLLEPEKKSNRLSETKIGSSIEKYSYDNDAGVNGCLGSLPGFSNLEWDSSDQLRSSARQRCRTGTPETTWYTYNSDGHRARKTIERAEAGDGDQTRKFKESWYLPGLDVYRTYRGDGSLALEKNSCVIEGGEHWRLLVEVDDSASSSTPDLFRYQIGENDENLELDDQALLVSYEEFTPFGTPTYVLCAASIEAPSKYRWAGYERDSETGLFYCHLRFYAPWLGLWISCDPIFVEGGLNVYAYCRGDPVNLVDPEGTMDSPKRGGESSSNFLQDPWSLRRMSKAERRKEDVRAAKQSARGNPPRNQTRAMLGRAVHRAFDAIGALHAKVDSHPATEALQLPHKPPAPSAKPPSTTERLSKFAKAALLTSFTSFFLSANALGAHGLINRQDALNHNPLMRKTIGVMAHRLPVEMRSALEQGAKATRPRGLAGVLAVVGFPFMLWLKYAVSGNHETAVGAESGVEVGRMVFENVSGEKREGGQGNVKKRITMGKT